MPATTEADVTSYQANTSVKPVAVEGLSEKLLEQHWKLYEGYVTNTNALHMEIASGLKEGAELNKPKMAELQRRFGFEYNGMVLHEYYFGNMRKGIKKPSASSPLVRTLATQFGSLEQWQDQFMQIGKMRGVGWTILYADPLVKRLVNVWVGDHEVGHIAGFIPVVVMDCWEHAYVLDYGASANGRADYVQTFFNNLNWDVVEERLDAAERAKIAPRLHA